ncbi:MAG: ComF family protein, partial [Prevotellaceae bacterium]|nr:ComF family protein [Prevotellaceae bacterium]
IPLTKSWEKEDNDIEKLFWGKVDIKRACSLFYFRKGSDYRPLIHKLKYKGKYNIGLRLGEELGIYLEQSPLYSDLSMIVPVPLHPAKERQRGYNQSEAIASGISNITKLPVESRNLIRTKYTDTQTLKNAAERHENVQSVFDVRNKNSLNGQHILLIDDIITTGSTIESCVSTILKSGCSCKISVASIGYVSN